MNPRLTTPILTATHAVCWLYWLGASEYAWHLDDDPADIINNDGRRVFDGATADALRHRLSEVEGLLEPQKLWSVYDRATRHRFGRI